MIRKTKILIGNGWKLLIYCLYRVLLYVKRQQTASRELYTIPDAVVLDPLTFPEIRSKGRPYHAPTCRYVAHSSLSPCRAGVPVCQCASVAVCQRYQCSPVPRHGDMVPKPHSVLRSDWTAEAEELMSRFKNAGHRILLKRSRAASGKPSDPTFIAVDYSVAIILLD